MVEVARLESVYRFIAYPGFESPSLRQETKVFDRQDCSRKPPCLGGFFSTISRPAFPASAALRRPRRDCCRLQDGSYQSPWRPGAMLPRLAPGNPAMPAAHTRSMPRAIAAADLFAAHVAVARRHDRAGRALCGTSGGAGIVRPGTAGIEVDLRLSQWAEAEQGDECKCHEFHDGLLGDGSRHCHILTRRFVKTRLSQQISKRAPCGFAKL